MRNHEWIPDILVLLNQLISLEFNWLSISLNSIHLFWAGQRFRRKCILLLVWINLFSFLYQIKMGTRRTRLLNLYKIWEESTEIGFKITIAEVVILTSPAWKTVATAATAAIDSCYWPNRNRIEMINVGIWWNWKTKLTWSPGDWCTRFWSWSLCWLWCENSEWTNKANSSLVCGAMSEMHLHCIYGRPPGGRGRAVVVSGRGLDGKKFPPLPETCGGPQKLFGWRGGWPGKSHSGLWVSGARVGRIVSASGCRSSRRGGRIRRAFLRFFSISWFSMNVSDASRGTLSCERNIEALD